MEHVELDENEKINLDQLKDAFSYLNETDLIYQTPLIKLNGDLFNLNIPKNVNIYLKLENMQNTGSFKIRGVLNQFRYLNEKLSKDTKLVTFSAGNYGKSFAYVCSKKNLNAKIVLPNEVSETKENYIKTLGLEVEKTDHKNILNNVQSNVKYGYKLVHPIDDKNLICGYSSITFEILNQLVDPDIVVACCGGGGLLAGISSCFGLLNKETIVYGVEPATANKMHESFQRGYPVKLPSSRSIALGLAPPITGRIAYYTCKNYVKDILLVTDDEIKDACKFLFDLGIKAELSGCAAFAALLSNKIPELNEKVDNKELNVVILITGGNASADELAKSFN